MQQIHNLCCISLALYMTFISNDVRSHEYKKNVILIAFALQQWLHESPSMLRYTYIASPVIHD
jgi:hypothetical protein